MLFAPKDAFGRAQEGSAGRNDENQVGEDEKTENDADCDHDAGKTEHTTIASAKCGRLPFLDAGTVN